MQKKLVKSNMICYNRIAYSDGEIAQLARAIGSYPIGHWFDPGLWHHYYISWLGEVVNTRAFHARITGSNPVATT